MSGLFACIPHCPQVSVAAHYSQRGDAATLVGKVHSVLMRQGAAGTAKTVLMQVGSHLATAAAMWHWTVV